MHLHGIIVKHLRTKKKKKTELLFLVFFQFTARRRSQSRSLEKGKLSNTVEPDSKASMFSWQTSSLPSQISCPAVIPRHRLISRQEPPERDRITHDPPSPPPLLSPWQQCKDRDHDLRTTKVALSGISASWFMAVWVFRECCSSRHQVWPPSLVMLGVIG